MASERFDAKGFIRTLLGRGWRRSDADPHLITHPEDHALGLRYDPSTDRLTISPELDAYLALVIPTPASRGSFLAVKRRREYPLRPGRLGWSSARVIPSTAPERVMATGNACQEVAVQVALRTGLLKRCPAHGELYDPGQHDFQGACMVAAYLINRDDPLVAPFRGDRVPLTDLLKGICRKYHSSCSECAGAVGPPPAGPA